jgi:glucose-1-phosphate thymidylyltransferase
MQGILLAGGMGTRLSPTTQAINKHLIPIYDKPMIYYPLTTLMLAGVREISLVSTATGISQFRQLLGDGSQWGINLRFVIQHTPEGIAHGISIALNGLSTSEPVLTILGDNVFYGQGLGRHIADLSIGTNCMIWTQEVSNPENFGIVTLKEDGTVESITEKPLDKRGNLAVTGLYYFPSTVHELVGKTIKSLRGEYEITGILNSYLAADAINSEILSRGVYWLDAGTVENLIEASQFVRLVQNRQGQLIGSPDEAALRMNFISSGQFQMLLTKMSDCAYKDQLLKIII